MIDHIAVQLAFRNQLLTATGIPSSRAWENKDFTPVEGTAYLEESYVPASAQRKTIARTGRVEVTGLYVVRYYGLANTALTAIWTVVNAILAVFPDSLAWALSNGDELRVRGDVAPYAGQILQTDTGHACVTIKVPWRCLTTNTA
jgi:hypothetical protein